MKNLNTTNEKTQQLKLPGCFLVCDVCERPLHIYGENFIDAYTNGKAVVRRCLCNDHAAELRGEVEK